VTTPTWEVILTRTGRGPFCVKWVEHMGGGPAGLIVDAMGGKCAGCNRWTEGVVRTVVLTM